ncbi:MAG: hypothetical protein E7290_13345 [Lachnospiraceae bacterium]|nr:hypothetical protein [Lachnospiraceae bacterium]
MAKKFGKFMLFSALAGAAAAGTYYYLQRKQNEQNYCFDDADDFDIFDEDIDNDMNASAAKNRSYVSLEFENAKEKLGEKVIEAIDKTKEKVEQFNVSEKLDKAKEFVEGMTTANPVSVQEEAVAEEAYEVPTIDLDLELEQELAQAQATTSETYTTQPQASVVEEFYDDELEG